MTTDDDRVGRHGVLSANRLERSQIGDDSLLVALEYYWNDLRGERRMPSSSEINPLEIGTALLPWIFLLDVIEDAGSRDYFYRLAGTSNVELVGRDPTGRLASDVFGSEDRKFMMATFDATVDEIGPTYWNAEVPQKKYDVVWVIRGLFQLGQSDIRVERLICIAVPEGS